MHAARTLLACPPRLPQHFPSGADSRHAPRVSPPLSARRRRSARLPPHHDALEHLVDDRWQDALVKVLAELLKDGGQKLGVRAREDAQGDLDLLQVLRAHAARDDARPQAHVEEVRVGQEGHPEMDALAHDAGLDAAAKAAPEDRAVAALDGVRALAEEVRAKTHGGRTKREATKQTTHTLACCTCHLLRQEKNNK